MKKSLNINLAGQVFHIDEDAYSLLSNYLDSLQRHYAQTEEGEEIITDIEARIAEIFQENLSEFYTVVTIAEVERAIELIGKPEDFIDDEAKPFEEPYSTPYTEQAEQPKNRKLYRDPDGRYVAGIAAGFAHFLGVAPIYVRAGFIVLHLFYGLGIILYLAMWIFIKEARTSAQKLEMRGEQVNLSNIEKTIRDEFENVKENVKKGFEQVRFEQYAHQSGDALRKVMEGLWVFIKGVMRLVGILIGVGFVIGGTVLFTALMISLLFPNLPFASHIDGGILFQSVIGLVLPPEKLVFATLGLLLLLGIPFVGVVYLGIKMIFNLRSNHKPMLISSLVLWIMGLGIVVSIAITTGQNYSNRANIDETVVLDKIQPDTIALTLKELSRSEDIVHSSLKLGDIRVLAEDGKVFGMPKFDIKKAHDNKLKLELERRSYGSGKKAAKENASQIEYEWQAQGGEIRFDHYFKLNGAERWLDQGLRLVLKLPVGKVVYLDESMVKIIYDIKNLQNMWDGHMGNKYWVMTEKGLSVLNPEKYRDEEAVWPETVQEEMHKELQKELREVEKEIREEIKIEIKEMNKELKDVHREVIQESEKALREMEEELEEVEKEIK